MSSRVTLPSHIGPRRTRISGAAHRAPCPHLLRRHISHDTYNRARARLFRYTQFHLARGACALEIRPLEPCPWFPKRGAENRCFLADLQHKVPRRGFSPYPPLALIFLQHEGFWTSLGRGCGTGLCCSSLQHANRNEHHSYCRNRCPN
jgi:hypothetical protein